MSDGIVIVGGGLAGQRCAETLRRKGYDRALKMVCAEARRPYDRPALSKQVISGGQAPDSLHYRATDWYAEQSIEVLTGTSAVALSAEDRRISLADGTTLAYDQLLIATGSRPRKLVMLAGYENVSALRTLDDALQLSRALGPGVRLAVIGAGFIGQEVAATARGVGAEVTMIEAAPAPLFGLLGGELADWFSHLHRSEGVELITDSTISQVVGGREVHGLRLADGRVIQTDHVLVGVGVEPDVEWLAGSELAGSGIAVDLDGRTRLAGVFAAGDAAASFDPSLGRHVPGSHWESAARQGARAGCAMLGLDPGAAPISSFWSDQYGIRIQYLGHARLADAHTIDGDPESRDFAVTFTRAGRPIAALLVGRPHALPHARRQISNTGDPCPTYPRSTPTPARRMATASSSRRRSSPLMTSPT